MDIYIVLNKTLGDNPFFGVIAVYKDKEKALNCINEEIQESAYYYDEEGTEYSLVDEKETSEKFNLEGQALQLGPPEYNRYDIYYIERRMLG